MFISCRKIGDALVAINLFNIFITYGSVIKMLLNLDFWIFISSVQYLNLVVLPALKNNFWNLTLFNSYIFALQQFFAFCIFFICAHLFITSNEFLI